MKRFLKYFGIIIALLILVLIFFYFRGKPSGETQWGLTFSYKEARGLGFDWKVMYLDTLADLKPKNIRLMTYWDDSEATRGKFDFTIPDQQLQEAQRQNINVVLVVGRKQPRWPECYEPAWFRPLDTAERDQAVLDMIKATVEHFKHYDVIKYWQVENEPFFAFGDGCPKISQELYKREVSLVKQLDNRPVVGTDSGERGGWLDVANAGVDIMGVTLYRVSYDEKYGGYYKYPIPPAFYQIKIGFLRTFTAVDKVWDVELQLEPWFTQGATNTPLDLQKTLMNPNVFADNIEYAQKSGFDQNYLWGVEWWYWMAKTHNDWGMWGAARNFFNP